MKQQEYLDLISRFEASSLTSLEIEEEGFRIRMEKGGGERGQKGDSEAVAPANAGQETVQNTGSAEAAASAASDSLYQVKAPLVGIFYESPSPEAEPFVHPGSRVEKGQILCILEAMKMMNELKSPVSGMIRSIGGVNGQMAEYGQVLFEVEPC